MLKPSFTTLLRHPAYLLAFGGGAGLAPKAPGTVGSIVALPLYLLLLPLAPLAYAVLVVALFLLGVWACARTERDLGVHDHPGIVWDEIVGMLVTLFLAPAGWAWLLIGFGAVPAVRYLEAVPDQLAERPRQGRLGYHAG